MENTIKTDFKFIENDINLDLLNILLIDRTTNKNIIWATNDYKESDYESEQQIKHTQVTVIRPRYEKIHKHQKNRTRDKAEIFTPSWICNEQNNLIDEAWFGRPNVFNKTIDVNHHIWQANEGKILFDGERTWKSYVEANRLEITCGEAPYLVSRYDTVSGEAIPIEDRIGLLDRKLRIVNENISTKVEWIEWAKRAFQSVYGYEFQGDSLFLARKNLFLTYIEYFEKRFSWFPKRDDLKDVAEIISWNLWQMNGLTNAIPYYVPPKKKKLFEKELFKPENVYCKIKNWKEDKSVIFDEDI